MSASTASETTLFNRATKVPVVPASVGYLLWPVLLSLAFLLAHFWEEAGVLAVAVFLFVPGYVLVRALSLGLDSLEVTFISLLAGGAILLTITNIIAMSPVDLSGEAILVGELIVVLSLPLFSQKRQGTVQPSTQVTDWLLALLVAFAPLLLLRAVFQHEFFMGYDPFAASYLSESIATQSISPLSFRSHDVNYLGHAASGFYYFTAGLSLLTGLTTAEITKYGGLALLGLAGGLVFLVVRAAFQRPLAGFLAATFFISSPFVLERYVMYIRENFALVLLLGLLLLLLNAPHRPRANTVLFGAFLTGAIFQTHPLVSAVSVAAWSALLLLLAFQGNSRREWLGVGVMAAGAIALFSFPNGFFVGERYLTDVIPGRIGGALGTISPEHDAFYIWSRRVFWEDLNLLALGFAPLGLVLIAIGRRFVRPVALLASPATVIVGMLLLAWLGAPVPVFRTIVYLALGVSILGGLGFALVFSASHRIGLRFVALAAAVYVVFLSAQTLYDFEKWSASEGSQVAAAMVLAERAASEEAVVLTPYNEVTLMLFAHVPDTVTDRRIVNEIVTASSLEELVTKLKALGARDKKIFFFISKQFARDGVRVQRDVSGGWGKPVTIFSLLRQNDPDGVSLGALPDPTSSVSPPLLHVVEFDLGAAYLYEITLPRR